MSMKKVYILLILVLLTGCVDNENQIQISYDNNYYQVAEPYKDAVGSYSIESYDKVKVETGLMSLSNTYFNINNSLYQEGQYLTSDEIKNLISKFNDTEDVKIDDIILSPKYIISVYEQNYLTTNNTLKGISLAIVVDSKQYYEKDGKKLYKKVDEKIALEYGVSKVQELVEYMHNKEDIKDKEIVVGIYLQNDEILGGNFKYIGSTKTNDIKMEYVNYNNQLLDSNYVMNNDIDTYNTLLAIKNSLSDYNNLYINAMGLYKAEKLISVDITLHKSGLKRSEILNISNIITSNLNAFKSEVSVKVYFKNNNKTQAFLIKKTNANEIETYILEE